MLSHLSDTILLVIVLTSVVNLCHCKEEPSDNLLKHSPWLITLDVTCPSVHGTIKTCGGSLIDSNWILTTATCVQCSDINTIPMIVADIGSPSGSVQDLQTTRVGRYIVDKVVIHYKFNKTKNNIALLHLQYPVVNSSKHTMMQVSKCYQVNNGMRSNSIELLSRYTRNTDELSGSQRLSDTMKLVKRKRCIKTSATCKNSGTPDGSTILCATFIQSNNISCGYDEGMALGIHSGNVWIMAGFVSEKPPDCRSCPTQFTHVCKYYEWVRNILLSTSMTQGTYERNSVHSIILFMRHNECLCIVISIKI